MRKFLILSKRTIRFIQIKTRQTPRSATNLSQFANRPPFGFLFEQKSLTHF